MSQSLALLERLVAYPSVSQTQNLDLVTHIADHLRSHGVEPTIIPMPDGRNANVFATIGPGTQGGVVLSGHIDVVPVEGQPWTSDPFSLIRRGSRLYGRGACDMKAFDACVLAAVPAMVKARLTRPIHICLSADEETRMDGVRLMLDRMGQGAITPELCIVGEPSSMKVVTGHKGYFGFTIKVRGHEVHSGNRYQGVSAVMVAARIVTWLEARDLALKAEAEATGGAPHFDPGWTMIHVGRISGGTAHNITARDCEILVGIRVVPGDSGQRHFDALKAYVAAEIEPAMKAVAPDSGISFDGFFGGPPLAMEKDGAAERLARALTGDNAVHVVPYGAEAGLFQDRGISTVICGPGDIAQAHQPDEWIEESEIAKCDVFLERLIQRLSA